MKTLKKLFCLLVLCAMLFAVSCAGESAENFNVEFDGGGDFPISFGGATFHIVDAESAGAVLLLKPDTSEVLSENSERYTARIAELERDYDCKIIVEEGDQTSVQNAIAAGMRYGDIVNFRLNRVINLWRGGYIIDLNDIPSIDLHSGKYGSEAILDALTWNGQTIALFPEYWGLMTPCFSDALMYNPRIMSEYGLTDPNELYEMGKWDWNALEEMGKAVDTSPAGDYHVYLSVLNNYFPRMLFLSNGARYVEIDASGRYVYGLDSNQAIDAMNFCQKLDSAGYLLVNSNVENNLMNFAEGKLLMIAEYSVQGISADKGWVGANMEEPYSWCFAPQGPSGEATNFGVISHENQFNAVTIAVEDLDMFGYFMELFYEKLYDTGDAWRSTYASMNFFDDTSANVFFEKFDNAIFDNNIFMYNDDTLFNDILEAGKSGGSIMQILQKRKDKAQASLDEILNGGLD